MKTQMLNKSLRKETKTMRTYIYISMLISLFVIGCSEESSLVTPNNTNNTTSNNEPNWINLPKNADTKLLKTFVTSEFITVAEGGQLVIDETYTSTDSTLVHAYSSITFAPGVVMEDVNISMEIDDETGVSTFLPHQMFNFPAILNQTFTGLNLSGVDPDNIELLYLSLDGNYEVMPVDQIIVDIETGTITVVNGRIPHFSRYGFVN